jgi:RHS repeat-associated protein
VDVGGVHIATYTYDRDGNRVKKEENGETTVYIGKYYEKNVTTGTETLYYFLGNKPVAYQVNSTVSSDMRYLHQDHLGSTSIVTDANGDAVFERSYDPWGNIRVASGTADMDRLYTGQRFDATTGLYYYNARYYDPTIARFISPDTIVAGAGDPQAWNRYAYVLGNPLRYTDPSGHCIRLNYKGNVVRTNDDEFTCSWAEYQNLSWDLRGQWATIVRTGKMQNSRAVRSITDRFLPAGMKGDARLFGIDVPGLPSGCRPTGSKSFSCGKSALEAVKEVVQTAVGAVDARQCNLPSTQVETGGWAGAFFETGAWLPGPRKFMAMAGGVANAVATFNSARRANDWRLMFLAFGDGASTLAAGGGPGGKLFSAIWTVGQFEYAGACRDAHGT